MLAKWIIPPQFDDDRLDYVARIIHVSQLAIAVFGAITWALQTWLVPSAALRFTVLYSIVGFVSLGLLQLNRSRPVLAGTLAMAVIWTVVTFAVLTSGGSQAPARFGYILLIVICCLAFSMRYSLVALAACVAGTLAVAWIENLGLLPPPGVVHTPLSTAVLQCYGLAAAFSIVSVASHATWGYIERRRVAEEKWREANVALDALVAKLNARVEQLEFVHRSAGVVSWVWDLAADTAEWFGDREALLGLPSDPGSRSYDAYAKYLHPDDRERSRQNLRDCLKGSQSRYRRQERINTPDGGMRWLEVMGQSETGADGRTVRVAGVMRDVTEQRGALDALETSERRFRGLFDSSLDGTAIIASDGTLLDVNPAACQGTGFAREELVGQAFTSLIPEEDLATQIAAFNSLAQRRSIMIEARALRKGGGAIPVEINAWRLADGNIQAILRDVSERKRAEERFAKIFRVGPGAITISRMSDGKYLDVNDEWYRWSGYTREETVGRTATEIQIWVNPAERIRLIAELKKSGSVRNFETRLRRKSGDAGDIRAAAEVLDLDGEPYIVISIDDVTERKRAELEIARLNASLEERVRERTVELEEANRDLESFSFSISHDLQAPLRSILGFAQIIARSQQDALSEEGKRLFARIEHNARRMSALIEDLLAFSRVGKGRLAQHRLVDMHAQVTALIDELDLQGKVELADIPSVDGDPAMLRQVWQNLILNALKFSRDSRQPLVKISGKPLHDGNAEFSVEDNGVGFDMLHADKLFGVFQRLHSERDFEGTGVGLAIVHRIISRHGGRISAQSAPGKGAKFTFVLPEGAVGA